MSRVGVLLPDDRFIPIRVEDFIEAVVRDTDTFGPDAAKLGEIGDALDRIVDRESSCFSRRLERYFAPFNPDRDTLAPADDEGEDHDAMRTTLGEMLDYMFDKANYARLDDAQFASALDAAKSHGMKIRLVPEKVASIDLYVRGRGEERRRVRTLRRPIKGEERDVELYRRLAVVFRMEGEEHVNIKLFREIPVSDLEALLPHAEVEMSPLDRLKIVGGGLGALGGVAWKIVEGTVIAAQILWPLVIAFVGLSVRSFLGYRRAKHVRTSQMTHNLYYQNVANNQGVLDLLVTSISDEEMKEVLLAYALLVRDGGATLRDPAALGEAAERWLAQTFETEVAFDVTDAIESLDRLDLWAERSAWRVRAPEDAHPRLEAHWRARASADYHARMIEGRAPVARGGRVIPITSNGSRAERASG